MDDLENFFKVVFDLFIVNGVIREIREMKVKEILVKSVIFFILKKIEFE